MFKKLLPFVVPGGFELLSEEEFSAKDRTDVDDDEDSDMDEIEVFFGFGAGLDRCEELIEEDKYVDLANKVDVFINESNVSVRSRKAEFPPSMLLSLLLLVVFVIKKFSSTGYGVILSGELL